MSDPTRPDGIYRALSSGILKIDGELYTYIQGRSYPGDHPLVVKYPQKFEPDPLGMQQAAILRALAGREAPGDAPAADEPVIEDGPAPDRDTDLTRADILAARREWQRHGPPQPWDRALVSKSTYLRYRHKYELVPWPEGYRHRLTP